MTVQDDLEYLKSLVAQLNSKIHSLEAKANAPVTLWSCVLNNLKGPLRTPSVGQGLPASGGVHGAF